MDIVNAMQKDAGISLAELKVDGGASRNNLLMQFQADILGTRVLRPKVVETTAMGAAMLAGRAVGAWTDRELQELVKPDREFAPNMDEAERQRLLRRWRKAIEKSRTWAEEND